MDCCEKTSGLLYTTIDCYDQNTPVIVKEIQEYLFDPNNQCTSQTNCNYQPLEDDATLQTNKCLISWALLQQYYNKCPHIVIGTTNDDKTADKLPDAISTLKADLHRDEDETMDETDYDSSPKLINPLIYRTFINDPV